MSSEAVPRRAEEEKEIDLLCRAYFVVRGSE